MGKKLQSEFLIADAMHTRSDIYVTIGVLVSLPFVLMGYSFVDPGRHYCRHNGRTGRPVNHPGLGKLTC